jgi:hypothetical protein
MMYVRLWVLGESPEWPRRKQKCEHDSESTLTVNSARFYDTIQSERVPPGYPMRIRKFTFYDLEYFLIAATNFHVNLYL